MMTYEQFETAARAAGFDDVLQREWAPGLVLETHRHPFAVKARVARGDFELIEGERVTRLQAGDEFELARDLPHAERYGEQGAPVWVARRHAALAT